MFDQTETTYCEGKSDIDKSPSAIGGAHVPTGIQKLISRLHDDGTTHFFFEMLAKYPEAHLKELVAQNMDDRRRMRIGSHTIVNFGSDSFLGFDQEPRVRSAIVEGVKRWGTHNGSSRAFCSVQVNLDAEERLARWLGVEDTLIFPSVTLANLSLLPAVAGRRDLLVVDRFAHNSIHEGAKIARADGAKVVKLTSCTGQRLSAILDKETYDGCVVALDGVYSMSGSSPPLVELDRAARAHGGMLYVDDAHGTGIFGERGRGMAARELGRLGDVLMVGSLSKAFSCMGAFVTCTSELKLLLKMNSSSYIFGGPVPPPYLEAICVVCDILQSPEYDTIIGRLRERIAQLVNGIHRLGMTLLGKESPIVAILLKDEELTLRTGKWLFDHGYYVQSVIFPAVPIHGGVLRIQVNANHREEDIDGLLNVLADMPRSDSLTI